MEKPGSEPFDRDKLLIPRIKRELKVAFPGGAGTSRRQTPEVTVYRYDVNWGYFVSMRDRQNPLRPTERAMSLALIEANVLCQRKSGAFGVAIRKKHVAILGELVFTKLEYAQGCVAALLKIGQVKEDEFFIFQFCQVGDHAA